MYVMGGPVFIRPLHCNLQDLLYFLYELSCLRCITLHIKYVYVYVITTMHSRFIAYQTTVILNQRHSSSCCFAVVTKNKTTIICPMSVQSHIL
jgi:hypothetical protein